MEAVINSTRHVGAFNTPLEAGVRAVCVLFVAYPSALDLDRLISFDHLVVHTGDADGPPSLHPSLPLRSTELLVRRHLVERGLLLMVSRGLIERLADANGLTYRAGELAATFVLTATSPYLTALRDRAGWVVESFGAFDDDALRIQMNHHFGQWVEQFAAAQRSLEVEA